MADQPVIGFTPIPRSKTSLPPRPPKRSSDTPSTEFTLPPHRRKKAPPLTPTNSFLFAGLQPLYNRAIIYDKPDKMVITCSQIGCITYPPKVINRVLSGTNNYKLHYQKEHPGVPLSAAEAKAARARTQQAKKGFFDKPATEQTRDERYRTLLLEFVIKNNLSFSIVDQEETKIRFDFLSPTTKQISRRTLINDLKKRYELGEASLHLQLQDHVQAGGRISLTTDGWAGNNKLDYIAVTGHWEDKTGKHYSITLDIIELTNPVHDGAYLCKKLLEVT